VTDYLRWIGEARKIDPKLDRDLWKMEKIIWGEGHKGPPTDRRKDLLRQLMVEAVLVTQEGFLVKSEYAGDYNCIDSSQGEPVLKPVPKKDVSKSEMVEWVAELESQRTPSGPEVRTIWGSLKRLKKRYSEMARALEKAGFNVERWIAEKLRELARVEQHSPGNLWIKDQITEYERQLQALRKMRG